MTELVPVARFRNTIPEDHRSSMDTRLAWLWKQRFGTVQSIWRDTDDVQDKTCCTLILQAVLAQDLNSIAILLHRLEGGAQEDTVVLATEEMAL